MTREAVIVQKNGRLMAQVTRSEACMACRSCSFGQHETLLFPVEAGAFSEGDRVEVALAGGKVTGAAFVTYGVPALGLIAGLLLGAWLIKNEYLQALCALAGSAAGVGIVKLFDKKIAGSGKYRPVIRPLNPDGSQRCGK